MKLFFVVLLLVISKFAQGQNNCDLNVFKSEDERFQLMVKADTLSLKKVLSDDLIYIHSNALVESKMEHISNIGSGNIQYKNIQIEQASYKKFKKLVLTTGVIQVTGVFKKADFQVKLRYTAVYTKQNGLWKLLRWQSVKITE